jgi:hypothetical protein
MDDTNASPNEACSKKPCCRPKCCWGWGIICLAALVGAFCALVSPRLRDDDIAEPPLLKTNAKQLKATVVSPVIEAPIQPGKNVLWCSTFQLVWNESCRDAGGDIRLKDEPPIVAVLNKKLGDQKDLDIGSCLVMSGLVQEGIVWKIRRELDRKFQGQADPDLLNSIERRLPRDGWLAYAYMFRALPFEHRFKRLSEPLEFGSVRVASFGLPKGDRDRDDQPIADQVAILDYTSDDDFIVALRPKDHREQIILAKVVPADTLQETIKQVRSRIKANELDPRMADTDEHWRQMRRQALGIGESVVIPVLNVELLQENDDLVGKTITTSGPLQGMPIVFAVQDVRFRLDETGTVLKSEASMTAKGVGPLKPKKPRQFIFDKPFLILLQRKDAARPYFALWVDNPELLVPFK